MEIDLIIRGQCTLVPGLRGLSSRIRVRSIVGRFLEHSRIFYFENVGSPEIYLGSADWMPRNLYERVEVLFPLKDEQLCERIRKEILPAYLADNQKARLLGSHGVYTHLRRRRSGKSFSVQDYLMSLSRGIVNGSGNSTVLRAKLSPVLAGQHAGAVESSPATDLEEQESSNATV